MSTTYDWLKHWLNGKRLRPLGDHLVVLLGDGDVLYVRLGSTDIMVVAPENIIKLDNGGWDGVRTKAAMNRLLPDGVKVYQKDKRWYVSAANGIFAYRNGMFIDAKTSEVLPQPEDAQIRA